MCSRRSSTISRGCRLPQDESGRVLGSHFLGPDHHVASMGQVSPLPAEASPKEVDRPSAGRLFTHCSGVREFMKICDHRQPPTQDDLSYIIRTPSSEMSSPLFLSQIRVRTSMRCLPWQSVQYFCFDAPATNV